MLELLLVLVGVLFSIICHGVTKRIIIASILSSLLSCMALIPVLGSVDTGGTLRSASLVVGFPIYFFISVIIGLFYRGLRHKIEKTTKAVTGDSPRKVKRTGRFIFKLAFNMGVFFILLVVIGNLGNVIENRINASKGDRKANMDIKNAYTASPQLTKKVPVSSQVAKEVTAMFQLAKSGDAEAQADLGYLYYSGEGVPKDFVKAYVWFSLALNNGFEPAKKYLDILRPQMTPQQIAQVESEAAELLKQINKPNQ